MSKIPKAQAYYEKRAKEGYGLQFPDGHVIRFYQHILKDEFSKLERPPRIFDFGCWNGTHAKYFANNGAEVAGADIIAAAIAQAKECLPESNIQLIDDETDLSEVFGNNFDLIFTNQVLYFLEDALLQKRLNEFEKMLVPGGLFFATMISRNNFYSRHVTEVLSNGLETVIITEPERLVGNTLSLRFMNSTQQLKDTFSMFECIQLGRYKCDLDLAHPTEHYIFLGRRR